VRDDDGDGIVDDVHGANFVAHNADLRDGSGHGTHIAGIIAAADPSARIMALEVGTGEWIDVGAATAAVYYAVAHGARILNMSWAFRPADPAFEQAIRYAISKNVLVVAAAGNFGTSNDTTPTYPASYASGGLLSVAATCDGRTVAPFSNYGKLSVSIAAPGCNITSTLPGGRYGTMSGTSMAAPEVAGAAALLLERYPTASATDLARALLGGAQAEAGLADTVSSGAALDTAGALTAMASPDRSAPSPFARVSPAPAFAARRDPTYYYDRITFSWTPSRDADLAGYRVIVDGSPALATGPDADQAVVSVTPGSHSWSVQAYDRSGNTTTASS
jgi:subtilisin family serine protease